jgi:hypothetical protein
LPEASFSYGSLEGNRLRSLGRWAADPGSIWLGPFNGSISTSYEEGKKLQLDWRNLADEDAANAAAKEFVR